MDDFLTNYNEEYCKKRTQRSPYIGNGSEFKDPINQGFGSYLQLSSDPTPITSPIENADEYLHKYEETRSKPAKIHFPTPISNDVIKKDSIYNGRSVYQCDYCDLEKDNAYKEEVKRKNMFRLPNDWDVPMSTQRYTHRDPRIINPNCMEKRKKRKVVNNLDPQHHIREILKVTTGKSEYGIVINDLGELIMNDELHGNVPLV